MKTIASAAVTAMASGSVAIVQLILMEFSSGQVALNMSTWDLVFNGIAYKGAFGLGTISAVTDKPGEVQGITLELFGEAAMIALALDDADIVQGTPITIRTAIISTDDYTVLDAPIEWIGTLDTMSIGEDGKQASIRVSAESKAVDLMRGTPQFYSEADQTAIHPEDHSFKYVTDQVDRPVVWPTKAFFYQ